jgi:hypothetical protein
MGEARTSMKDADKMAGKAFDKAAVATVAAGVSIKEGYGGVKHGAKGVGFSVAAGLGAIKEGFDRVLANALGNVGRAFLQGASNVDGRQFTIKEILADPTAKTWSERMMANSFKEFSQSGASFKKSFEALAASVAAGTMAAKDLNGAAKYLESAAGHTLEAAKATGEAVVISGAEEALILAQKFVKSAERGAVDVADQMTNVGMKLIEAQNRVNTVNSKTYLASVDYQ